MQVLFFCECERDVQEDSNSSLTELNGTGAPAKQSRNTSHFRGMRHHLPEQLDSLTNKGINSRRTDCKGA